MRSDRNGHRGNHCGKAMATAMRIVVSEWLLLKSELHAIPNRFEEGLPVTVVRAYLACGKTAR